MKLFIQFISCLLIFIILILRLVLESKFILFHKFIAIKLFNEIVYLIYITVINLYSFDFKTGS